jgi:hypothetical protein
MCTHLYLDIKKYSHEGCIPHCRLKLDAIHLFQVSLLDAGEVGECGSRRRHDHLTATYEDKRYTDSHTFTTGNLFANHKTSSVRHVRGPV